MQRSLVLRREIANGHGERAVEEDGVSMDSPRKGSGGGVCEMAPLAGYRKWGLLGSFLVTAVVLVVFLCHTESRREQEIFQDAEVLEEQRKNRMAAVEEKFAFHDTVDAFRRWDESVGCSRFRRSFRNLTGDFVPRPPSFQDPEIKCSKLRKKHVGIHVKSWTWIPDNLDNLYSCGCGLSCLWTKSPVLADKPDALFYEWNKPPVERKSGDPLRIYIDIEPQKQRAPAQDIFVSYHHSSDVQATYAGALFHNSRNYYISPTKNKEVLVYWSSSRCLPERQETASKFLALVNHHSFGKCLNNVGERDAALEMYPECRQEGQDQQWNQHLHCAMSHYKFALAIENTRTESYVTEKLFYALDAGTVPIYFGAPNVMDFVPPKSIILASEFSSMESLAEFVKGLAQDPVRYAEYHAWRRCGVTGNYYWARALSLDSLPCRLCAWISRN
ncbi:alpha-(1,4)-fucosyltransferase-like [Selaginella moellendorffii]|uniref:alpha-(1,4)-fucosyltransferase-like n=1 Tax=Selaginella moellendorffii TaxID=88036 RepID=UPI000D1C3342|nr:alpha-(1,4)-fucosyltransferase-like [Selaginella moellendorffii]|eukprot:XP_024522517.1 alpha-(1,4)-fucosyltransferase-like [Selaginella moellendorffii]